MSLLDKLFFSLKRKNIFMIEKDENKDFVKEILIKESLIGIDTEFDWRNTYFPKLSLLQISTSNNILLIDCLKCKDLRYLKDILENEEKLIILHSSRSDATVLNTNLKIKLRNIFDIQIAEKKIQEGDVISYGSIVQKYYSIKLDKSETNSNWLKRPFSEKQLSYAAEDVLYLIDIYKKQLKILKKLNLLEKTITDSKTEVNFGNQELYKSRLKRLKKSTKSEKKVFLWREEYAKKENIPTSYIFKDRDLKKVSKQVDKEEMDEILLRKFFLKDSYLDDFIKNMATNYMKNF